jgi:peptidoglycan/xylan/chitin deacetylase (PgdA/CDA1 family)
MMGWLMGGAAGLAGLVVAGYNTMAPRSQLYGRTFVGGAPGSRELALTFDDGPNDPFTFDLLEVLAKHEVKATFFMVGRYVKQRPEIAAAVAREGHVIGNHTFTHPNLIFRTPAQVRSEIAGCEKALGDAVEKNHSPLFRPPWGARTPLVLRTVRQLGMTPVLWSVTGYDWSATSAADIKHEVTRQVQGGDVVLLHDGGHKHMGVDRSHTVQAVDDLLHSYKEEGYAFRTVSEMITAQKTPRSVSV